MSIQWFPGHMHKARKEIARVLATTDVVIEVLDARLPASSSNPMLDGLLQDKPRLRVLTRADLADAALTERWLQSYSDPEPTPSPAATHALGAIAISHRDADSGARVLQRVKAYPWPSRSIPRARVAMVVGIPNVGKSTLINLLAGRSVARTGNEPAVTRQQQQTRLGDTWSLRDTPGVMWPNVENPYSGYRLAASGAIRDTAMDSTEVAVQTLDYLRLAYGELLQSRFGPDLPLHDSVQALEAIGRQRGCLGAGALVDFDRSARVLLTELRAGQLGRITLETPEMQADEQHEVTLARQAREAHRKARKEERGKARRRRRS